MYDKGVKSASRMLAQNSGGTFFWNLLFEDRNQEAEKFEIFDACDAPAAGSPRLIFSWVVD